MVRVSMIDVINFVVWLLVGILVFLQKERPSKFMYGLCWVTLMLILLANCF